MKKFQFKKLTTIATMAVMVATTSVLFFTSCNKTTDIQQVDEKKKGITLEKYVQSLKERKPKST